MSSVRQTSVLLIKLDHQKTEEGERTMFEQNNEPVEMVTIPRAEYEALKALIPLVETLTARVAELEARLNKNSKNSGKPPSTDKKGTVKNSRISTGKASGGQPGHIGSTLKLNPAPDTIIKLTPKEVCECGGHIKALDGHSTRQQTDIEPVKLVTIEYHAHSGVCELCNKEHKASFPKGINSPASYGDNISAWITYLTGYQLLPLKRTTELVQDLLGIKLSQGTIVARAAEAYDKLETSEELIKEEIINSPIVHVDETGMRVEGSNYWLHSAGTDSATVYGIHKKRGKEAMDDMAILPKFRGTLVHDHWRSYYGYNLCAHAECNIHHLRTLIFLHEELGQTWAEEMIVLLLRIKKHVDLSKLFDTKQLEQADIDYYQTLYRKILAQGLAVLESTDSASQPIDSKRMLKRLSKFEQETLLFMLDFDVPFTNNLAERDIRMPKTKQKISGGFRNYNGAKHFSRVRGFISTSKKKGKNVLDGLISVFGGNPGKFLYPDI